MANVKMLLELKRTGEGAFTATVKDLEGLDQAFDKVNKKLKQGLDFSSILQGIGQGIGQRIFTDLEQGALSVGRALLQASEHLIETTSRLTDLRDKTGVSAEGLQELAYAGSLVGVGMDNISGALSKMQKNLIQGSTAFGQLNLDITRLREMKPEDAFRQIGAAIAGLRTPAQQAAAAIEVFGKAGATMLPLLKSNMAGLAEEARKLGIVIGEDTATAGDALGDSLIRVETAWEGFQNQLVSTLVSSPDVLAAVDVLAQGIADLTQVVMENKDALAGFVSDTADLARGLVILGEEFKGAVMPAAEFLDSVNLLKPALAILSPELAVLTKALKDLRDVGAAAEEAHRKLAILATGLADPTFGRGKQILTATLPGDFRGKDDLEAQKKAAEELEKAYKRLAQGAKAYFDELAKSREARETFSLLGKSVEDLSFDTEMLVTQWERFEKSGETVSTSMLLKYVTDLKARIKELPPDTLAAADAIRELAKAQAELMDRPLKLGGDGDLTNIFEGVKTRNFMELQKNWQDVGTITDDVRTKTERWAEALDTAAHLLDTIGGLMEALGVSADSTFGKLISGFASVASSAGSFMKTLADPKATLFDKIAAGIDLGVTIFKAIKSLFGKPEWERIAEDTGRRMGVKLSEGLAKAIEQTMKDLGVGMHMAELLNLDKIIAESGRAASSFGPQVIQLLQGIKLGAVPAAAGIAEVGKVFAQMAAEAAAAGGIASQAMVDIIEETERLGIVVPEVQKYVVDQFTELADVSIQLLKGWREQFDAGAIKAPEFAQHVRDAAREVYAMFERLTAQGLSMVEIFRLIGPLLDEIQADADRVGQKITGPESRLFDVNKIVEQHKKFFDEIALQIRKFQLEMNTGIMNPELLQRYSDQVKHYYDQLIAFGLTPAEALAVVGPLLGNIEEAARRLGITLDPMTQSLVDAGHASGAIKTDPMQTMVTLTQIQVDLMAALVVAVGGVLPESWLKAKAALDEYNRSAQNTPVPTPPPGEPYDPTNRGGRGYAGGGIATGPLSGHWELLHGREAIIPLDRPPSAPMSGVGGVSLDFSGMVVNQLPGQDPEAVARAVTKRVADDIRGGGEIKLAIQDTIH